MASRKKLINLRKYKEIRKKMIDLDIKVKDLAEALGVSQPFISFVLRGKRKSRRVAEYIEKRLGVKI